MTDATKSQLETLLEKRNALADEAAAILDTVSSEDRDINEVEEARSAELNSEMRTLTTEIELRESIERSRFAAEKAAVVISNVVEPHTYKRSDTTTSYYKDLATSKGVLGGDVQAANERLQRHAKEVSVDNATAGTPFEVRAGNTTDGSGGYLVPPTWLMDEYAAVLRNGRAVTSSLKNLPMVPGTDVISLPVITRGTLTGTQSSNNTSFSNQDIQDSSHSAAVTTIGGYSDWSIQALDQSPLPLDQIIFTDLVADLNQATDVYVINAILGFSGINTVTYTDASPAAYKLWAPLGKGLAAIATNRKRADGVTTWMTPNRFYAGFATGVDASNRPLVLPAGQPQFNGFAQKGENVAEGYVGVLGIGTPVCIDGNIPSNLGAGTNQDVIIQLRGEDVLFFESEIQTAVFPDVLSATGGVRFRAHSYQAVLPKYAQGISVITGTGLINS